MTPNKSLQVTFDPPPFFATAKTAVASNAPELRRQAILWQIHVLQKNSAKSYLLLFRRGC